MARNEMQEKEEESATMPWLKPQQRSLPKKLVKLSFMALLEKLLLAGKAQLY